MLNLAEDVQMNGLLGNQQIVVVYSDELNKYVVYEGNRRIAAIKLLLNPDRFSFLDRASIERAKRIAQGNSIPTKVNCYITDEQEAFFIMERTHSGEDKGRGTKQWTPREKEAFRVRRSHQKKVSYLIDFYIKQYYDNYDITTVIPFTTMERIFNNREVKKKIGLDVNNEQSFTESRMKLVIDASSSRRTRYIRRRFRSVTQWISSGLRPPVPPGPRQSPPAAPQSLPGAPVLPSFG